MFNKRKVNLSSRAAALMLSAALGGSTAFVATKADAWSLFPSPKEQGSRPVEAQPTASATGGALHQIAARSHGYQDGRYTGPAFSAYYGRVKVQAVIRGGRIVAIHVLQHPNHNGTSRYINAQALPMLKREVIRAQNVRVYMVSGATLTSRAFLRSTYAALRKAGG